jgi:hypothetical protein
MTPELVEVPVPQFGAVESDLTRARLNQPDQQSAQRTLSCGGRAHHRHGLTGFDGE